MKKTKTKNSPDFRKVRIVKPYALTHTFKAGEEFRGKSIVEMMSTRFPFHSSEVWEGRLKDGKIGFHSKSASSTYSKLNAEDEIYHHNASVIEPTVPDEVEIIQETEHYLAVYKPAPLPMHPGGRFNRNSLTYILEEKGYKDLKITHRLDSVTSGLVLFAKSKEWAKILGQAFSNNEVEKSYLALVSGNPDSERIEINSNIRRRAGFVFESGSKIEDGKSATTVFEVVERFENRTLVKCLPRTGRTHQIRLHLAEWGFPIIDDKIYGIKGDKSSKTPQNTGISLISYSLFFQKLKIHIEIEDAKARLLGFVDLS